MTGSQVSGYILFKSRITANYGLESVRKEAVMAYFQVTNHNLYRGTEKSYETVTLIARDKSASNAGRHETGRGEITCDWVWLD
jgi:hypothetical protein